MSVHKAISQHSQKQHDAIKKFLELDTLREMHINEAINRCATNQPFTVEAINQVTKQINDMAVKEIVPTRKMVTVEMIQEYVKNKKHQV